MIARIWRGWTRPADADAYESLLRHEVFPGIEAKRVAGLRSIRLLRGEIAGDEVEFVTILLFDSLDAVREFAGDDYEAAYVPPAARRILSRYDRRSRHYEVRDTRTYRAGPAR